MNNKTEKMNKTNKRKTMKSNCSAGSAKKRRQIKNKDMSRIVRIFLEVLNMVKLYHWKTRSYAQHKATDELYSKLNENIDEFIEILMGKAETRIKMVEERIELIDANTTGDFKQRIYQYRNFLTDLNIYFDTKKDSDLLNIRDEILGNINQFLYLMSFDKI